MRHRLAHPFAITAAIMAIALTVLASPRPTSACTSEQPTFDQTMAGAQAVAWVQVVLGPDGEVQPGMPPLRITEVIHGNPQPFIANGPRTGLCGDTIHYLYGDGAIVLVAFGVPFFGEVIHPSWWRGDDGLVSGTAGMPFGVTTIEGLEAAVRDRYPAAQPEAAPSQSIDGSWLVIAAITLIAAVGLRIAWRRRPQ